MPNITLIYKYGVEPEGALLSAFYEGLKRAGYQVFYDQTGLTVGDDWYEIIDGQIRNSVAVVALLSDAAASSEMVLDEIRRTLKYGEENGNPKLLPIRIKSDAPMPGDIGRAINHLQFARWFRPTDTEVIIDQIVRAISGAPFGVNQSSRAKSESVPLAPIEPVGECVPLDSPYYIAPPVYDLFLSEIEAKRSLITIKGYRRTGKTSLLLRGVSKSQALGWKVLSVDTRAIGKESLASYGTFCRWLAEEIQDNLNMPDCASKWRPESAPNRNLERYLDKEVLPNVADHLVLSIDGIDRLSDHPWSDDFFGLIRSWHNKRSSGASPLWSKLTVAMSISIDESRLIKVQDQSAFNVYAAILLSDFTAQQVHVLNRRYGPILSESEIGDLVAATGGHPYLCRVAFNRLRESREPWSAFMKRASFEDGPFGDHLRRLYVGLKDNERFGQGVRDVLARRRIDQELFQELRTAGILAGHEASEARFRCGIYEPFLRNYFNR